MLFDDTGSANPNVDLTGTLVAAGITVNNSAVDYTFSGTGTLAGSTGLVKNGTSRLTITGAHTYLGNVAVNAGVLNVQNATALGSAENGAVVASGAALELQGGIAVNEALNLSGTGVSNGGVLRNISGNNSISGSTTNTASIVLATSSRINSDADTLALNSGITGTGFALTVGGAGNVIIGNLGINTGAGGSLVKDGTGTLTISASSNYDGTTTINNGTVLLGLATAINTSSGVNLGATTGGDAASLLTNAAGTMSRNFTVRSGNTGLQTLGGNAAVSSTFSGTVTLGTASGTAKGVTLSQIAGGTAIFSGVFNENTSVAASGVTVGDSTHTGIVRLSNAVNAYGGNTIINGGTLEVVVLANGGTNSSIGNTGSAAAAGSVATGLQIDGATLRYIGTGGTTNRLITISVNGATLDSATTTTALSFTGTGAFVASGSGDRTFTLTGTSGAALVNNITSVIANPSSDTTSVTKSGANTWQLAGANTYTGTTTVSGGTLAVTGSLSGTTVVNNSGTLLLNSGSSNIVGNGSVVPTPSSNGATGTVSTTTYTANTDSTLAVGVQTGKTNTFATLTLNGNSTLDFGGGTNNTFIFNTLSLGGNTLTISNWAQAGTPVDYLSQQGSGSAADSGTFGDGQSRLLFVNDPGFGFGNLATGINFASGYQGMQVQFGSYYEIVPVPEPATTALIGAVALCALIGYRERRRFSRKSGANSAA